MRKFKNLGDVFFILPAVLICILFLIVPLLVCFYYSTTNFDGFTSNYRNIGLKNFIDMCSDTEFIDSIKTTIIMTVAGAIFVNVLGILLAVWFDKKEAEFGFCKALLFIPCILSSVVVSFIWSYMTQTNGGIINTFLGLLGIPGIDFFQSKISITLMVTLVINWAAFGLYLTIYDATLKTIPQELYEACKIDGASFIKKFFYVTLPLLSPGITICTVLSVISGLRQFDFVKIVTPKQIYTITVYAVEKAFDFNMFGYSSAVVLALFLMIIAISVLNLLLMKKLEVHY